MRDPDNTEHHPIDHLLRRALQPEPDTVRRVARAAFVSEPRRRIRLALAAAASVLAFAVALLALSPLFQPKAPPAAPAGSEAIVISNEDGVLTVTTPSGCEQVSVRGDHS
jgi:hypothetical protein